MNSLLLALILASCSISLVGSKHSLDHSPLQMDSKERTDFLASVEAEEDWLDRVSRRLSLPADACPPTDIQAATDPRRTARRKQPADATPSNKAGRSKTPKSAGPNTRATRKRRLSNNSVSSQEMSDQGQTAPPGKKSSRDDGAFLEKFEQMIAGVRGDIAKSEANTAARIDTKLDDLSDKISDRLSNAESSISSIGGDVARMKTDVIDLKRKADTQARSLTAVVEDIVSRKLSARVPIQRPVYREQPAGSSSSTFENKYWDARKSLRMWPIAGPDLAQGVIDFLRDRLLLPADNYPADKLSVQRVTSTPSSGIKDQVIVKFDSVRLRDEAKSAARNLGGSDRSIGLQLEAPDHLRSHYQAFQKLGFQIKNKHPGLKRNVKFDDIEKALVMDIKTCTDSDWKTLTYIDAKTLLKKAKSVPRSTLGRAELDSLINLASPTPKNSNCTSDSDDDFADAVVISDDENKNSNHSRRYLSFLNANARSLTDKVDSLCDCLVEKDGDLGFVTETWFQDRRDSYQTLREYTDRFSLGIINRNRTHCAANLRQYGGVAIIYRYKTAKLDEFPLSNPDHHEVVAAVGKISGIKGQVFCVACYAPPNLTRATAGQLLEYLSDVVSEGKRKFRDCTIIICGDFNQWPVDCLLDDHPDLTEVHHGPTRGDRSIDRSFVNFGRSIIEATTLEPLETEDGRQSDHRVAWAKAEFLVEKKKTSTFSYRKYTEQGAEAFLSELSVQSWANVYSANGTSSKVEVFQTILDGLMNKHFKFTTVTRSSSDPPWFNSYIKKRIGKRRKVYDKQGRSRKWKKMKSDTDKICRNLCKNYIEKQKKILTAPDASRAFYRNVKTFKSKEKPPIFDVKDLYPECDDLPIAEKLADHFNAISNEFDGLQPGDVPAMVPNSLNMLTRDDVIKRLTSFKKPKSMVRGDIFPALVNRAAADLSLPLLHIYNTISLTQLWPDLWKIEYVTPIPKKTLPKSPSDLRNISCTQLFSKVYESFILEWLGQQVKLRLNQYGGVKGSGTEHFLVNLWQNVLENIEDPRAGSLLTSIDFAKAFNRLNFSHVIKCLRVKGADLNLVRIVASFLSGRVMRVKVGSELSIPRPVLGGVPQGSLLGVFLFNLAIDDFEAYSPDVENYNPAEDFPLTPPAPGGPQDDPVPPEPTGRDARHTTPFCTQNMSMTLSRTKN